MSLPPHTGERNPSFPGFGGQVSLGCDSPRRPPHPTASLRHGSAGHLAFGSATYCDNVVPIVDDQDKHREPLYPHQRPGKVNEWTIFRTGVATSDPLPLRGNPSNLEIHALWHGAAGVSHHFLYGLGQVQTVLNAFNIESKRIKLDATQVTLSVWSGLCLCRSARLRCGTGRHLRPSAGPASGGRRAAGPPPGDVPHIRRTAHPLRCGSQLDERSQRRQWQRLTLSPPP